MVKFYIDDILNVQLNKAKHESQTSTVLKILNANNLEIICEKSKFRLVNVKYLGLVINAKDIRIGSSMAQKEVFNIIPKTKRQL